MVVAPTHFVVGVNVVSVGLFVHVSLKNSPKFSSFDMDNTKVQNSFAYHSSRL